jgi:hypothetical protein
VFDLDRSDSYAGIAMRAGQDAVGTSVLTNPNPPTEKANPHQKI